MNGNSKCMYVFLNDLKVIPKLRLLNYFFEHIKFVLYVHQGGILS